MYEPHTGFRNAVTAVAAVLALPLLFGGYAFIRSHDRVCYLGGTVGPTGVHTTKVCYPRHREED
jgi:hypothetical protein